MTPLEMMAKAAYDEWIAPVVGVEATWEELPDSHRWRLLESQRAAILVLADAELPQEFKELAYHAACDDGDPEDEPVLRGFRAVLREIAKA